MNRALLVAVWLILAISAQATDGAYRFNVYMFDGREMYRPIGEGEVNPDVGQHLFVPPHDYDERFIPVGTNVVAFGVVAVTGGKTTRIIPLFKRMDDKGTLSFACSGPTPWFARWEESESALVATIIEAIRKK